MRRLFMPPQASLTSETTKSMERSLDKRIFDRSSQAEFAIRDRFYYFGPGRTALPMKIRLSAASTSSIDRSTLALDALCLRERFVRIKALRFLAWHRLSRFVPLGPD